MCMCVCCVCPFMPWRVCKVQSRALLNQFSPSPCESQEFSSGYQALQQVLVPKVPSSWLTQPLGFGAESIEYSDDCCFL